MAAEISGGDMNEWISYFDVEEITEKGDLGMLLLLKEKGLDNSSWLYSVVRIAAFHGHLHVLICLHRMKENILALENSLFALRSGNLELIQWFRNQDTPCNHTTEMCAVQNGNVELLQYLHDNGCVFISIAYRDAVYVDEKEKVLEIFKWLHHHKVLWDEEETCLGVAKRGNLDALMYARNNDCPWDERTITRAVQFGHIDVIKYCLENDCPIGDNNLCGASMTISDNEKALKVLKLLRTFNIPWNEETCERAAYYGNLDALKCQK